MFKKRVCDLLTFNVTPQLPNQLVNTNDAFTINKQIILRQGIDVFTHFHF